MFPIRDTYFVIVSILGIFLTSEGMFLTLVAYKSISAAIPGTTGVQDGLCPANCICGGEASLYRMDENRTEP